MKKFLLLLSVFVLFGCSSDESKDDSNNSTNHNFIEYNGEKFYFTEATVKRIDDSVSSSFLIAFTNSPLTNYLDIILAMNCKNCPLEDVVAGTYSLSSSTNLKGVGLIKYKNDSAIKILSRESLTTTVINNVIVTKNPNGTYGFKFNFVTPSGVATGEYTGELKKLNY